LGWTKGKPRGPRKPKPEAATVESQTEAKPAAAEQSLAEKRKSWTQRAGNSWKDLNWEDRSEYDQLSLPQEVKDWAANNHLDCNWKTQTCYGQAFPK
jgi:hypothetical protein